jgi:hypothetical protein
MIPVSAIEEMYGLLNPLHVYCRLLDAGFCGQVALRAAWEYEQTIFKGVESALENWRKALCTKQ